MMVSMLNFSGLDRYLRFCSGAASAPWATRLLKRPCSDLVPQICRRRSRLPPKAAETVDVSCASRAVLAAANEGTEAAIAELVKERKELVAANPKTSISMWAHSLARYRVRD
jgi:hypothetical protein